MNNLKNATADAIKWWICHHFTRRNVAEVLNEIREEIYLKYR